MNKVTIIGNLTRDPELRSTRDGTSVCTFTVAVNRRGRSAEAGQPEADFFRVTVWRQLGETCAKYLTKGRKVCVIGPVILDTYTGNDGVQRANLSVTADDVEFLSPRGEVGDVPAAPRAQAPAPAAPQSNGFVQVDDDELPF